MRRLHLIWLLGLILAIAGCGGGGASSTVNSGGGAMFATDSLDNNAHVWITIDQIVMTSASGNITVFDDPNGIAIDLKTLRDSSGERYSFLANVPQGAYTGLQVTVDKNVTIFPNGSSTGVTREFAPNNGTTATMSLTFSPPQNIGPNSNFALDFDLGDWDDNGATITGTPFLKSGTGSGLNDPNRHEKDEFNGSVANLGGTAPAQTFVLVRGRTGVAVTVNANTIVYGSDPNVSAALANGQRVTVDGSYSVADNAILADWIEIHSGNDNGHPRDVEGSVSTINSVQGTFIVTLHDAHGFHPDNTQVTVQTNGSTVFRARHGMALSQADFFAAVQNGSEVHVEGTFDASTSSLTATRVRLEDHDGVDLQLINGAASNISVTGQTFDVTVQGWEGLNISRHAVVHVLVNASTTFGIHQTSMTAAEFFAALTAGKVVTVTGTYDESTQTMTASNIFFVNRA